MPRIVRIDPLSLTVVRVQPLFGKVGLATATGFTVSVRGCSYLITNWHVVSGRDANTGVCLDRYAAIPDHLLVTFHAESALDQWAEVDVPLISPDGETLWIEHPLGPTIDVIALPLTTQPHVKIFPLDLSLARTDIDVLPALPISVIGFPYGLQAGENWPIWKTGHVASDPEVDFQPGRPAFLIDATTREGMSGAPVVLRSHLGHRTREGSFAIPAALMTRFVGVYAGRIHDDSEIGRVWRAFTIEEILERRLLFNDESGRTPPSRNAPCPCGKDRRFKRCCGALSVGTDFDTI